MKNIYKDFCNLLYEDFLMNEKTKMSDKENIEKIVKERKKDINTLITNTIDDFSLIWEENKLNNVFYSNLIKESIKLFKEEKYNICIYIIPMSIEHICKIKTSKKNFQKLAKKQENTLVYNTLEYVLDFLNVNLVSEEFLKVFLNTILVNEKSFKLRNDALHFRFKNDTYYNKENINLLFLSLFFIIFLTEGEII